MFAQGANFNGYFNLPHRKLLTSSANDGTINPRPDDAGNWTYCGKGKLVGTYRDISACAATAYYGYEVDVHKLRSIDYNEAKRIIKWIWDSINASEIPNQDIANITMHIKMHFGNVGLVQKALVQRGENIGIDGVMGSKTLAALKRKAKSQPIKLYNSIRFYLEQSYNKSNPVYKKGFLKVLKDFPKKKDNTITNYMIVAVVVVLLVIAAQYAYKYFYKNANR